MLEVRRLPIGGALTVHGEALIAGALVHRTTRAHAGSESQLTWEVPNDVSLVGLRVHAQGLCIGNAAKNPSLQLSNALDLLIGF